MLRARAIFAGLIALLVTGNAWGKSKLQSAHSQQPIQAPSTQTAEPSAPDQRAPDQRAPDQVSSPIKIIPGERTKEQAEKEERERREKDEKASIDKRLADQTQRLADETENLAVYTGRLAGFTLLLFFAAVGQIGLFVWQLRLIRKSLDDAKIAADAATIAARAAKRSAIASVTQAKIARDTLTKVQRPWIFVFGVKFLETRNDVAGITPFVEYTVANYGQTPAIVLNMGASFSENQIDPGVPLRVDDDHPILVAPILEPDKVHHNLKELIPENFIPEDLGIMIDLATGTTHPIPRIADGENLFFKVIIEYRGAFTKGHVTSACWRYSRTNNHFVQYGHADYNYEQ